MPDNPAEQSSEAVECGGRRVWVLLVYRSHGKAAAGGPRRRHLDNEKKREISQRVRKEGQTGVRRYPWKVVRKNKNGGRPLFSVEQRHQSAKARKTS